MTHNPTRRSVLIGGASTLAAAGFTATLPGTRSAWGRESLTIAQ